MTRNICCFTAIAVIALTAGCSNSMLGTYVAQVRLVEGKSELEEHSLNEAKEKFAKLGGDTISLLSGGKYTRMINGKQHEGDWWVEDNGIAIRCRKQGGIALASPLVSKGYDQKYDIRGKDFVRFYNSKSSNLEVVYAKK